MTVAYAHLTRISPRAQDRDRRMTWYYWACRAGEVLAPAVGIAGAGKVVDSTSQLFSLNPFTIPPFAMLVTFGVSFFFQLGYLYKTRHEPNNPALVHAVGLLDDDGPVNLTRPGRCKLNFRRSLVVDPLALVSSTKPHMWLVRSLCVSQLEQGVFNSVARLRLPLVRLLVVQCVGGAISANGLFVFPVAILYVFSLCGYRVRGIDGDFSSPQVAVSEAYPDQRVFDIVGHRYHHIYL